MSKTQPSQGFLFPLPYKSEAEIRAILRPYHPFLWPVIMEPWDDLVKRRGNDRFFTDLSEEQMGIWLTMQAGNQAKAIFQGKEGVTVIEWYRKPAIVIPDALAIIIKKVTKRQVCRRGRKVLTRSNARTQRDDQLYRQERNGDLPDLPRIVLGYELVDEATRIRLHIAYPRTQSRGFDWVYRFNKPVAAAASEFPKLRVVVENPESMEQPGYVISPADIGDEQKVAANEQS